MPDSPDDLTPAQERAVRDLLASARHTAPVPDDVAARLDATLADLAAEREPRAEEDTSPAVVPLAGRRRRRIGLGLAAAAAVVVGGVAVTQVVPQVLQSGDGESMTSSQEAGAGGADDQGEATLRRRARGRARNQTSDQAAAPESEAYAASAGVPRLDSDTFARDVRRVRHLGRARATTDGLSGAKDERGRSPACDVDPGPGRAVLVRYDGERALLVLRKPADGQQLVDVYRCGATEPLRSVELSAP